MQILNTITPYSCYCTWVKQATTQATCARLRGENLHMPRYFALIDLLGMFFNWFSCICFGFYSTIHHTEFITNIYLIIIGYYLLLLCYFFEPKIPIKQFQHSDALQSHQLQICHKEGPTSISSHHVLPSPPCVVHIISLRSSPMVNVSKVNSGKGLERSEWLGHMISSVPKVFSKIVTSH